MWLEVKTKEDSISVTVLPYFLTKVHVVCIHGRIHKKVAL